MVSMALKKTPGDQTESIVTPFSIISCKARHTMSPIRFQRVVHAARKPSLQHCSKQRKSCPCSTVAEVSSPGLNEQAAPQRAGSMSL